VPYLPPTSGAQREPTARKLPLRAARRARARGPGLPSSSRPAHPGPGTGAACAGMPRRRSKAHCAGRGHRGKEKRPLTEAKGSGGWQPAGRSQGHSPAGARKAASSRAPAARQDRPGRHSHGEGESACPPVRPVPFDCPTGAASLHPDRARGPQLRRMPPPAPTPFLQPPPPFHPSPLPPPLNPHRNGKYLPGRGAGGGGTPLCRAAYRNQ
jgi:hypothetical protein